jgi:hypothetical protein
MFTSDGVTWTAVWGVWLGGNMVFVLEAISKGVGVFGVQFDDLDA